MLCNAIYLSIYLYTYTTDLYNTLQHIYGTIYIEYVTKNPLYQHSPNSVIECPLFTKKLNEYLNKQAFNKA